MQIKLTRSSEQCRRVQSKIEGRRRVQEKGKTCGIKVRKNNVGERFREGANEGKRARVRVKN